MGVPVAVDKIRGALSTDDAVSDCIRLFLVAIANLADATLELHTGLLLDNMSGLMCRRVEARRRFEGDVIA